MAFTRGAVFLPSLLALLVPAQAIAQPVLKLVAQDVTGAFVQNAVIEIQSDLGFKKEIRTDARGETTILLDPGHYLIAVVAQGFEIWKGSIEMNLDANRSVTAKLKMGNVCSPCITIEEPTLIEFEHSIPDVELSLIPLEPLPLPAHRLRLTHLHRSI